MNALPKNVRVGRNGRIGILKKVPQDLWQHPRYLGHAKVIERSTGTADVKAGVKIALRMLAELDREFAELRGGMNGRADRKPVRAGQPASAETPVSKPRMGRSEQTRQDILSAAMAEFSERGLDGARIDDIAARTSTTKPMIYYHFGSKEKLYAAVIDAAYGGIRDQEQRLHLDDLPPERAMRRLVEVTFDHHAAHPEYVRLICVENMERARHISELPSIVERNAIAIETVRKLLLRGGKAGVFRSDVDPWHLHLLINSFCFMRVSNRYTWRAIFERDLWEKDAAEDQRGLIVEAVLRYLKP